GAGSVATAAIFQASCSSRGRDSEDLWVRTRCSLTKRLLPSNNAATTLAAHGGGSHYRRSAATRKAFTTPSFGARASATTMFPPERIACLSEETVEPLYLLGEQHRIVGVSGYCVRPPEVRREKPRVSAFTSADIPKILALAPDLVLAFSDLQAGIVADL